ncbi:hypothetical protein SAMN05880590_10597 [Rhizobium sp. RU35A]|uniref:DUF5330 domain-containing protein n=1 Tax=Rhizobium sp. RU35A TaxID=1907414 RepID=UPI00095530C0|nr:DUF5330 domain-containing protein [Rhizobium sp. RU35A]SIQ54756.1 hypothetical protein SAMN05880590_10597 [Rhizobium sp. RU35A]
MWFLIKGSVFFAMGLVVLSYFSTNPNPVTAGEKTFQVSDAINAATEAYSYLSAICVEKPDVCQKGSETLTALGFRAKEGARVAFQFLDSQLSADKAPDQVAKSVESTGAPTVVDVPRGARQPLPQRVANNQTFRGDDFISTGSVPVPLARPIH